MDPRSGAAGPAGAVGTGAWQRRVIEEPGAIVALAPEWRALADVAARSPFESPDWLLPWLRHYGTRFRPRIVTWWHGDVLAGVAPLAWSRERRRGLETRQLSFWGSTATPLRGWVGILAREQDRAAVAADLALWLADSSADWDLLHCLRLPAGSSTTRALARAGRWWRVSLTGVVRSREYVLDLPGVPGGWRGSLGPKARHNVRTEVGAFERRMSGRIERVTDPGAADGLIDALRRLMTARWGADEAYFRADPAFGGFLADAVRSSLASGAGAGFVARDAAGIQACLVTLTLNGSTVALLIGVTPDPTYGRFSLGKCLFHQAIDAAVDRGSTVFDFLTVGEYKESFWHARGRILDSALLGRGLIGRAVVGYVTLRRRILPALVGHRSQPT